MRRILVVLAVGLVMAAMVVAMALPAFAAKGGDPNGRGFGAYRKQCEQELGGTYFRDIGPGGLKHRECQF
jgi:hypothetical protein